VVRCLGAADVAHAVTFAREEKLLVAVRAGGHNIAGHAVCDGGLLIDLSLMKSVNVDSASETARVEPGATLADFDKEAQAFGLATPLGINSTTGVAGLTLGGGFGWTTRKFGLTIDNLISADVVTADGRLVRASAKEHPDLFWALRGGGGNFGVVTAFEFALHELSELTILASYHHMDDARRVLSMAQQVMSDGAPDELLWTSFVRKAPPLPWMPTGIVGRPGLMSVIEWSGDPETGRKLLGEFRGELRPIAGDLGGVPFGQIQTEGDEFFGPGLLSYVKATFADELTAELIDVLADRGRRLGSEVSQIEVLSMGGAIRRVAPDATAFPHRNASWLINVPASWRSAADTDREISWVRGTFAALQPVCSGGAYVNFMDADERASGQVAYGATLRRLQAVKAVYDAGNIFRLNQNIVPRAAS
jgi:hypothetical protein